MNFFGHAVVACWRDSTPGFVLGAMLPDFASMCGGRLATPQSTAIARGIEWHHDTDRAFHKLLEFRALTDSLVASLRRAGVNRGSALGGGHVGVELLLDGLMTEQSGPAHQAYELALRCETSIAWQQPSHANDWEALREKLADRGVPTGYQDAATVADRVIRVLARRPLLIVPEHEQAALRREVEQFRGNVADALPALMNSLRERMRK